MSKPPKQKWIDNLYGIMNADPVLQPYVWEFQYIQDKFLNDRLTEEQAIEQLQNLKTTLLPTCRYQHTSEKLIDGTIQFILKKNFEY